MKPSLKKGITLSLFFMATFPVGIFSQVHFTFKGLTGDSYAIVIQDAQIDGQILAVNDEIGVFTPAGLCVGASVWMDSTTLGLTAWADDSQTPEVVDGYKMGEQMSFRIWDASVNGEFSASPTYSIGDGTFGYGTYSILQSLQVMSTGIGDSDSEVCPRDFGLSQNWPNPFNPVTAISYQLSAFSEVELSIFNISGEKVRSLIKEEKPAGKYVVVWDGRDNSGKSVSGGIYLCRIRAGQLTQTRKMIFNR